MFRESLSIRSRRRHSASAMVVWAPLLFSQWAGNLLSCSLVRWASRLWAVQETQDFWLMFFTDKKNYTFLFLSWLQLSWSMCHEKKYHNLCIRRYMNVWTNQSIIFILTWKIYKGRLHSKHGRVKINKFKHPDARNVNETHKNENKKQKQ